MRLSNQSRIRPLLSPNSSHRTLWTTLERIRVTLKFTDQKMAQILKLSLTQLTQMRAQKKELSVLHIMWLADYLNISFELIMTGNIDYQTLSHHFSGNYNTIPERYRKAPLSKMRTPIIILNYVERFFGWKARVQLLNHFQMTESFFLDPNTNINFLFASDLCDYLSRYFMNTEYLPMIGTSSILSADASPLRNSLQDIRHTRQLYERMFEDLIKKYFEKNFSYKIIQLTNTHCIFSSKPSPELLDALGQEALGAPATAFVKRGIAAAYPMILDLPPASVTQTASYYQGDKELRYEIDFSITQKFFESRNISHSILNC